MKPRTDVDKLYATALGRLDDVSRYLDEMDQLRAVKTKKNGNGSLASEPDACEEAAEESKESQEAPEPPESSKSSEPPPVLESDDSEWEEQ